MLRQTVDQLAAGQDQMAREITRLHAADLEILQRIPAPPPQPPPAPARKPMPKPLPVADTSLRANSDRRWPCRRISDVRLTGCTPGAATNGTLR